MVKLYFTIQYLYLYWHERHEITISVYAMRFSRRIMGVTTKTDKVSIWLGVESIEESITKTRLNCWGYMIRMKVG